MKTAILTKDGMLAVLGVRELATGQAMLMRWDPRNSLLWQSLQDDLDVALQNLTGSVLQSVDNGWSLVSFGAPNWG